MGDERLRVIKTDINVLMGNLRGELGEVVTTWLLLRHFMADSSKLRSEDPAKDLANKELAFLWLLIEKLQNDLIGRLSELADEKIGRTNFFFVSRKLNQFESQVQAFTKFVVTNKLRQKRNQEIAHREQPEHWFEDCPISIPYRVLVKSTAMALRLIKRMDRAVLGPASPLLWREARKKRYELSGSPRAMYKLVPFMRLSDEDRIRVVEAEQREGKVMWSEMEATINGKPARVLACKEWGLLLLGTSCIPLAQYPLQKVEHITFSDGSWAEQPASSRGDEKPPDA